MSRETVAQIELDKAEARLRANLEIQAKFLKNKANLQKILQISQKI